MSYLGISVSLLDVFYFIDAIFIILFVFERMYVFGIRFRNCFPRLQEHLDKILEDLVQNRYHMETILDVCFIATCNRVMLGDDDPYATSAYLFFIYLTGLSFYYIWHG